MSVREDMALVSLCREALRVDLVRLDLQHVAATLSDEDLAGLALVTIRFEHVSQLGDVVTQRAGPGGRLVVPPHLLKDALARKHLTGMNQQQTEQRLLPGSVERNVLAVAPHLQRAEDAELKLHDYRSWITGPTRTAPESLGGGSWH